MLRFVIHSLFFNSHDWFFARFAIKHLHTQCYNLSVELGFTIVFISISLQTTLDENQTALLEILLANLPKPTPGFHIDPFRKFLCLAVFALPAIADCKTKMSDFLSGGC